MNNLQIIALRADGRENAQWTIKRSIEVATVKANRLYREYATNEKKGYPNSKVAEAIEFENGKIEALKKALAAIS